MAGATYRTRSRKDAKGKVKWYADLNFDNQRTLRYAGYSEDDADALGVKLCYEFNQNRAGVVNDSDQEIEPAILKFLDREGIKDNTIELNRATLEHFKINNPKVTQLKHFTTNFLLEWKRRLKDELKYKDGTIQIRLRVLKAFVRFCVEKGWLARNPIPKKFVPTYHSSGHYYTEEERNLLLSPIPTKDPQQKKADDLLIRSIKISQYQGLRLSQVWGLCVEHYREIDNRLWTPGLKGADDKWVICHPVTKQCIMEAAKINGVKSGRVFSNWGDPEVMGQAFSRKRDRLAKANPGKLKEGRYHDNKHTCVSMLQDEGYNLDEISEITNTTKKALMFYTHADKAKLEVKFKTFNPEEHKDA